MDMVRFKLEKPAAFVITDNLTGIFAPQIQPAILYRLKKKKLMMAPTFFKC